MVDHLAAAKVKPSLEGLESALAKEGITMVQRRNSQGFLYGLTYVDHKTGAIFNGSALGKSYSAKEMQERFSPVPSGEAKPAAERKLEQIAGNVAENDPKAAGLIQEIAGLLGTLTATEYAPDYVAKHYTRKKKRRKRGTS